ASKALYSDIGSNPPCKLFGGNKVDDSFMQFRLKKSAFSNSPAAIRFKYRPCLTDLPITRNSSLIHASYRKQALGLD
ncbi:MAG: hypothetical protein V1658_00295, partial [Candidatus Micrarchaeota archaeon]